MFLLKAYMPDRFRHAHESVRQPGEPLPLLLEPVGEALARLEPVTPADPHLRMTPDELADELEIADLSDGKLPHWYRARGEDEAQADAPLGAEFERLLEEAKRAAGRAQGYRDDHEDDGEYDEEDAFQG
ncbi:MAG: hypothetical protein ABR588_04745 [Sphingomicrobium sp.]|nr:hypothetical protein [Sphingomonadales bacterium]